MKINSEGICNRLGVTEFSETVLSRALGRVPKLSAAGPWIAGGAVRKTLQCVALDSDWDLFFANQEQADKWEDELAGMGAKLLTKAEKNSTYILPTQVIDGSESGKNIYLPEMKIQAIKFRYYESADAVIDSFDFTVSQFAYDGTDIFVGDFALWDVARKRLVPHRISYATSSLRRLMKYSKQGFTVCSGALSNILEQVVADPSIIHSETLYID